MRLTCPNCNAQYEVATDAIGAQGRDVQCSNCECTWFVSTEVDPDTDPVAALPELEQPVPVKPSKEPENPKPYPREEQPAPPPKRDLQPDIKDVLRQEAARELKARQRNLDADLEPQDDLDFDTQFDPEPDVPLAADVAPSRNRLPDIEEINSSLSATPIAPRAATPQRTHAGEKRRRKAAFRLGFVLALLVVALLTCAYVFTPQLIEAFPQLSEPLNQYVLWVNDTRQMLFKYSEDMINALQQSSGSDAQ